ncbi:ABC transporter ATP-binding protein [Actinotalea sp. Marseille-Q4924]|uniref:ABC transporter ATP-binding protein n=1 Tax=Actinotalea sp. Marseille-Q4924 TaxID=2866571 RepID=UPI001CE4A5EA|nr:ABC transporter ATP-binding protein [Actinotalea sp. Marseille-Q4924]
MAHAGGPRAATPARTARGGSGGLEVRDVVVLYRDDDGTTKAAVDGLDLDVAPGEVVALLGPSGSGKSSLLRAVAGLEPVARGSITWGGTDLAGVPVHQRGIGLMFQDGQLFPHRDVAANVAFGLQMQRVPRPDRARRVAELLELVGLDGFGERDVSSLSGGERQRVALARSLAPRPRLVLLDEPLSALDRALRERLADDVRTALHATGTTALFVTHDHDEAFAVADRIAVMDVGRLLQVDPPARLWHRPASRRVAQFLGYEAFVAAETPAGRLLLGEGRVDGAATLLAVGPGSLVPADDDPAEAGGTSAGTPAGTLTGTVVQSGFRRGVVEMVVDVPDVGRVTVVVPSSGVQHGSPGPGTTVALRPRPEAIAVVDG